MSEDSSIVRHLRAGQDQLTRIGEAVAAFRRLAPEDYGPFLATIEADLGGHAPELVGGESPRLLAGPAEDQRSVSARASSRGSGGTLREAVLALIDHGNPPRSGSEPTGQARDPQQRDLHAA